MIEYPILMEIDCHKLHVSVRLNVSPLQSETCPWVDFNVNCILMELVFNCRGGRCRWFHIAIELSAPNLKFLTANSHREPLSKAGSPSPL